MTSQLCWCLPHAGSPWRHFTALSQQIEDVLRVLVQPDCCPSHRLQKKRQAVKLASCSKPARAVADGTLICCSRCATTDS